MTVPQVRLASMDFSRVEYLSDKEREKLSSNNGAMTLDREDTLKNLNDLGIPII